MIQPSAGEAAPRGDRIELRNGRVLTPAGVLPGAAVVLANGLVERVGAPDPSRTIPSVDVQGAWVLPGIVDLHCDALLHHLAPRGSVQQSVRGAEVAARTECLSWGITHPIFTVNATLELGVHSIESCAEILDHLRESAVHLRVELIAARELPPAALEHPRVSLVGLNNHAHNPLSTWSEARFLRYVRARSPHGAADEARLLAACRHPRSEWVARVEALARSARVPVFYHDLEGQELVDLCSSCHVRVAEFVVDEATATEARRRGMDIVLGAPNVLRGGSHNGQVAAAPLVADGRCSALCSDYYLPAAYQAPFRLARLLGKGLAETWPLVSAVPAALAGLSRRGRIEPGAIADVIVVRDGDPPRLSATWTGGVLRYASEPEMICFERVSPRRQGDRRAVGATERKARC